MQRIRGFGDDALYKSTFLHYITLPYAIIGQLSSTPTDAKQETFVRDQPLECGYSGSIKTTSSSFLYVSNPTDDAVLLDLKIRRHFCDNSVML